MQLVTTLLVAVAILTILSGISTIFGSKKRNKMNAVWFFIATIGLAVWSFSISSFLSLPNDGMETAKVLIVGIIAGITLADIGLLGYAGWRYKLGKFFLVILALVGAVVTAILATHPEVFYSSISLNNNCNQMELVKGWYYYTLIVYYTINTFTFLSFLMWTIRHTSNKKLRLGMWVFYAGLSIGGLFALLFDLIFLSNMPNTIWVGPMALSITMLCYYYSVVRYRVISLSSNWMKILSSIIMITTGVIIYMLVFYAVFTALFKIPNPSPAILLLNFIMVAVALCLVPAINEMSAFMRTLVTTKQINIGYVVKNLNKLEGKNVNLKELATFLADHLHSEYVGFLINGKLYGSGQLNISSDELKQVAALKTPQRGIWQDFSAPVEKILSDIDIVAIAKLYNGKGLPFGQILIGKSIDRGGFDRRDLIEFEMIINLAAIVINSEKRIKA